MYLVHITDFITYAPLITVYVPLYIYRRLRKFPNQQEVNPSVRTLVNMLSSTIFIAQLSHLI